MFLCPKPKRIAKRFRIKLIGILILLIYTPKVLAQDNARNLINDSLTSKNYKELSNLFYKNRKEDTLKATMYAQTYLWKAKTSKDTIKIADGFLLLSRISDQYLQLKYCDSAINLTKYLNHKKYPATGYFRKGFYYFYNKDFKKSLDLYLKAYDHAKNSNTDLAFIINHNIGVLRVRIGDHKKALEVFKNSYNYAVNNEYRTTQISRYLKTIFALSNEYRRNHILDSAEYYCNIGIEESIDLKNDDYYNLLLTKGILQYENKKDESATLNLLKSKEYYENSNNKRNDPNLAFAYFYYAKVLLDQNNASHAIENFKKVDSIFQIHKDIHPEIKGGYKIIIDYYKKAGNKNLQLEYIEKLITVDSVLNSNYKYLNKKITTEYDTPILILEKEKLISELNKEKKWSLIKNSSLIIIILIIGGLLIYNFRKKIVYKQKFDELMKETIGHSLSKKTTKPNTNNNPENIGLSKELVDQILSNLDDFVEKEKYLNKNLTIVDLAKKFGTNTKYLSKIINTYKEKNFTNYINDLRVDYAIAKLKNDHQFRKYSIKAISESVGYGKAESFSKAFYKKTGILPSYFIKRLEK